MGKTIGIAGIQMTVHLGEDNSELMLKNLRAVDALFPWVDIIFFSELCMSGVHINQALEMHSPALDKFADWAEQKKKWVIPGSFYEKEDDKIYNTAVVISPEGNVVARYRKMFPWEPLETTRPGEDFCVFDIPGKGCFGLCICYDQWFPEMARTLAWMGAEAVFCPTATATPDRAQEIIMAQANAIANQMYWLSLNGVGAGGIGQSIFVDPEGRILQRSGEGERIMTEIIDLDLVSRAREFGTLGQCQVLKSFAKYNRKFPVYQDDRRQGTIFKTLNAMQLHKRIG